MTRTIQNFNSYTQSSFALPLIDDSYCRYTLSTGKISKKQMYCNCKKSQCLKLYCECFAAKALCACCACKDCHNNLVHELERNAAIQSIEKRNSTAFIPKIAFVPDSVKI